MSFIKTSIFLVAAVFLLYGCGTDDKRIQDNNLNQLSERIELDQTVGAFANIFSPGEIVVEGYGIVAGLNGKGSAECPPRLREYLIKYIQQMLGNVNRFEATRFLNSEDNAVVLIYGKIPAGASRGDRFDVMVQAISSSQTLSLNGGSLYTSDMTSRSRLGVAGAKRLATAEGPVFIDALDGDVEDQRIGRVIGGGRTLETNRMYIELNNPDFQLVSVIRDRINERFGDRVANALTAEIIILNPPARYRGQHRRFARLISSLYIPENDASLNNRITALVKSLEDSEDRFNAEIALEAIGRTALRQLQPLLGSENERTRLRAARCMLSIGYNDALSTLIRIASDNNSTRRLEAVEAIRQANIRTEHLSPLRRLLGEEDFEVRYAVYELLRDNDDMSISTQRTMGGFTIVNVPSNGPNVVYISRESFRHIVLFGKDIELQKPVFVRSGISGVTLNASDDDPELTMLRQNPVRTGLIGPIKSGFKLSDVIIKLTDSPSSSNSERRGLGVDYTAVTDIIKQLADTGTLNADLKVGNYTPIERRDLMLEQLPEPLEMQDAPQIPEEMLTPPSEDQYHSEEYEVIDQAEESDQEFDIDEKPQMPEPIIIEIE